jgi:hypothetical protein
MRRKTMVSLPRSGVKAVPGDEPAATFAAATIVKMGFLKPTAPVAGIFRQRGPCLTLRSSAAA